jgi:hypothetical protein
MLGALSFRKELFSVYLANLGRSTHPILVLCSRNISPTYFVSEISQIIGAPKRYTIAAAEGEIVRILASYPRPIFLDQANYLNERSLGTICYIWEKTKVPIVLAGTSDLYTAFMQSTATEDARAQISSRVTMYYQLTELSAAECKAIVWRGLEGHTTDQVVAQIYNVTAGIYRHVEMIIPRILELIALNKKELASGKTTMENIIKIAGSRLAS